MQPCAFRSALRHLFGGRFRDVGIGWQKRPPCAHRVQLHLRHPLEMVKIVPGFRDVLCADHDAMVSHEENIRVTQDTRQTVPLPFIEVQAVIVLVDHRATIKLQRGLPGPVDFSCLPKPTKPLGVACLRATG